MLANRIVHVACGFIASRPEARAAGKIGDVGAPRPIVCALEDREIVFHFKPACFRIELRVPLGTSAFIACGATVTMPGFAGCA